MPTSVLARIKVHLLPHRIGLIFAIVVAEYSSMYLAPALATCRQYRDLTAQA